MRVPLMGNPCAGEAPYRVQGRLVVVKVGVRVNGGQRSPNESGWEPLAGRAGRQRQEAEENGASVRVRGQVGHVADALRQGDGGGPAS